MKIKRKCLVCPAILTKRSQTKFCSLKCAYIGRNSNTKYAWTEKEIEELRELYFDPNTKSGDLNLESFAKKLGRLDSNVCRKARELGLKTSYRRKLNKKRIAIIRESKKKWMAGHPGQFSFRGGKHTPKFKEIMSERVKRDWKNPDSEFNSATFREMRAKAMSLQMKKLWKDKKVNMLYTSGVRGRREDLGGIYFRSKWEANIARVFNFLKLRWEYEPQRFDFIDKGERRGVLSYLPDFKVYKGDNNDKDYFWYEVKGWLQPSGKSRLKKFKKYYPEEFEKLIIIIQKAFTGRGRMKKDFYELTEKLKIPKSQIEFYNTYRDNFRGLISGWE